MNAVVTGGSRGIGAAIVRRFAAQGIEVALVYRSGREEAEKLVASLPEGSAGVRLYSADLSKKEEVLRLGREIKTTFGPVGILVNNAGMTRDGLAVRMKDEQFTEVIDTNLVSAFLLCREFLPDMMKARAGRIINMASIAGVYGNAGQANYAASKAGLIGLTKSLAKEVGSRGITVNAVAPGFIDTDMTRSLSDSLREAALDKIPLRRLGLPDEVAAVVSFLAGNEASYITGQVIEVSGGLIV